MQAGKIYIVQLGMQIISATKYIDIAFKSERMKNYKHFVTDLQKKIYLITVSSTVFYIVIFIP